MNTQTKEDTLFYRHLVDACTQSIIVTNKEGKVVYSNPATEGMFLYAPNELLGKPIEVLIPKESQHTHFHLRQEYEKSPRKRPHGLGLDVFALKSDNQTFPSEISLTPFVHGGERYTASIISDITERKEKEKKIQNFIVEQQNLKRAHIETQLLVLKNQISPHYLFNCLSVLFTLIENKPKAAKAFSKKLIETYGYVLETKDSKVVPLKSELDFLKNYIFLQEVRFGNKFSINVDDKLLSQNKSVVPLSLQILIENAFKHNKLSTVKPLKIDLSLRDKGLVVSNTLFEKAEGVVSHKIGLKNLFQQYRLLSDKTPIINNTGERFEVWLPLLNEEK